MPGGQMQLTKYGTQNSYLNGNPQMTYFKAVYKRHTNFSMEIIRLDFEGAQSLANNVDTQMRCKISRNGDLINKIYFVISIPDIYSPYYVDGSGSDDTGTNVEFQWVPNLGCQIIRKCTLSIGGNKISELYGQWIEIWHEIFLDTAGKNKFDYMTGHTADIFMPAHNGWNRGFYPTSTLTPDLSSNPESDSIYSNFLKNPYIQPPSIRGRQLYVPLPFWFCTNPGLALPLVALQYHEVNLEIETRPITELYTIIETRNDGIVAKGARTAPSVTLSWHHIGNFVTGISPESFVDGMDMSDGETNIQGWNMDAHLLVNYIFLDGDERKKFALNSHEYLIEQVYRKDFTGIIGTRSLNLQFQHPVKYLVWCAQRSDVSTKLNRHNNYTNWIDEYIPPGSDAYIKILGQDSADPLYYQTEYNELIRNNDDELIPLDIEQSDMPNKFNFMYYQEDIIKSSRLLFDGVERYSTRDGVFFRYLQPYQHNIKTDKSGIYMYSFSLEPSRYQPSGSCNMSRISNVHLEITTCDVPAKSNLIDSYDFDVYVYAINYNILRITSGMAGTAFAN